MSPGLIIFGTGAHARKAYHCATLGRGVVRGFADENPAATSPVAGVPMCTPAELAALPPGRAIFVAIGHSATRQRLMDAFAAQAWQLPALVHPRATVAPDALLADGCIVAAGAVVESGARIGRGAIVDVGAIVDHDAEVAAFSHLRPGQVCPAASRWPV